jgi:sporulation protein YlmC with PRC-barrel domain
MLKTLAFAGLTAAVLAAPAVVAQTNTDQSPPAKIEPNAGAPAMKTPDMAQPGAKSDDAAKNPAAAATDQTKNPPAAAAAADQSAAPSFVSKQATNQWRASKLVGVAVYGSDQKKVGSIKDVLVDHDGAAQVIVIGVGGFLGIGAKDVGVPFKAVQWKTEARVRTTPAAPGGTTAGGASAPAKDDPAAVEASQGYPDMGVLTATEAQLKSAPEFHYAPYPTADNSGGTSKQL